MTCEHAKELACGHGMVGVNIMVALKHYKEHVLAAVEAGADVIISGAGPVSYTHLDVYKRQAHSDST